MTAVYSVSGSVSSNNLYVTVNGVRSSGIPLPESDLPSGWNYLTPRLIESTHTNRFTPGNSEIRTSYIIEASAPVILEDNIRYYRWSKSHVELSMMYYILQEEDIDDWGVSSSSISNFMSMFSNGTYTISAYPMIILPDNINNSYFRGNPNPIQIEYNKTSSTSGTILSVTPSIDDYGAIAHDSYNTRMSLYFLVDNISSG